MSTLGNLLWFIFGGFWQGLSWLVVGLLWCFTIIGIPIGLQCFKFAGFTFFPFGKSIVYDGHPLSLIVNILWFFFGGIPLALSAIGNGILLCLSIVGIPFGLQCFKFAKLALMPIGARVIKI